MRSHESPGTRDTRTLACNCWVQDLLPEEGFGLRWGAHGASCPLYRTSVDPVDRAADFERRDQGWGEHLDGLRFDLRDALDAYLEEPDRFQGERLEDLVTGYRAAWQRQSLDRQEAAEWAAPSS